MTVVKCLNAVVQLIPYEFFIISLLFCYLNSMKRPCNTMRINTIKKRVDVEADFKPMVLVKTFYLPLSISNAI